MKRRGFHVCAIWSVLLAIAVLTVFIRPTTVAAAAAQPSLNTASKTLQVGESFRLKLNNAEGAVKWKSDDKNVVSVNSKGKVKGLASGTATVTAVYKKKSYPCTITVEHPNSSDDMEDKMIGPVNICYSTELYTETANDEQSYVWTAKNASGSDATEIIKLNIMYTFPKVFTYGEIEEQFAKQFKEEKTLAMLKKQGYTDAKLKRVKKTSYKIPSGKAFRASARISAKKNGEDWNESRVIYIFSISNHLYAISGQALDGGDLGNVDSTIKGILKSMILL